MHSGYFIAPSPQTDQLFDFIAPSPQTDQLFDQIDLPSADPGRQVSKNRPQKNQKTLYIGDIEEKISELDLYYYFSRFGPIASLRLLRDQYLRNSRGFAFVTFHHSRDGTLPT